MITRATIVTTESLPTTYAVPHESRGAKDYPVDAWDLIAFGRSPLRWVNTPRPDPDDKPDFSELVRLLHLTPELASRHYLQRPETYEALRLACPKCGSTGPARVCRACNMGRRNVVEKRPWSHQAKYCAQWTADAQKRLLKIVPAQDWQRAIQAVAHLNADSEVADLLTQSTRQLALRGTWHDEETGLDIPLRSLLAYAPASGESHDDKLASLTITRDASPIAWAAAAYYRGQHVAAALKQDLYAAATADPRPTHLWVLVERDEPHLIGRRRTTPEMLNAGRQALTDLLAAYAKCLDQGVWPAFDPERPGSLDAWTQFHLEPWMTQGDGRAATYFGVHAAAALAAAAPSEGEAPRDPVSLPATTRTPNNN